MLLIYPLLEDATQVCAMALGELASCKSCAFRVEDLLHRIDHVAGVLRCSQSGYRVIVINQGSNGRHFGSLRLPGIFDRLNIFVSLLG
ncbi:hypothetical protein [Mycobacterium asiaticum]|uniref:hypothetical protein n=1 Tax=Mycobacterium asiaticum TaxID=1790 RepID=UPI0012DB5EED|nr:hypothetical protein [Mycobacterium asiaticum]